MAETLNVREELERLRRNAPLPMIAARIKRARKASGSTHDQVCEAAGMYRANLIGLEQGKHRPRMETLERIAQATNRDVRWFIDPELEMSPFPAGQKAA